MASGGASHVSGSVLAHFVWNYDTMNVTHAGHVPLRTLIYFCQFSPCRASRDVSTGVCSVQFILESCRIIVPRVSLHPFRVVAEGTP